MSLYYEDGQLEYEVMMIEGLENGEAKTFFKGGELMVQMFYENGLPVKTSTEFYKSGAVKGEIDYVEGLSSSLRCYLENGRQTPCKSE